MTLYVYKSNRILSILIFVADFSTCAKHANPQLWFHGGPKSTSHSRSTCTSALHHFSLESQPSLEEPLSKGLRFDVICHQIVTECPRLMEVLSRAGNSGHSVFRIATALQHCSRIHSLCVQAESHGFNPNSHPCRCRIDRFVLLCP